MRTQTCDICVVGAGSGGFGAALAAARSGAAVLLFEAAKGVGGTSTWAGVNNYEPVRGPPACRRKSTSACGSSPGPSYCSAGAGNPTGKNRGGSTIALATPTTA